MTSVRTNSPPASRPAAPTSTRQHRRARAAKMISVAIVVPLAACGGGSDGPLKTAVPATVASATACNAAVLAAVLPANAAIASAVATAAPVPHCRVRGTITHDTPNPNTVKFSVAMPDSYSGRYVYDAPGGSAGSVRDPQASLLARGDTVATSDQGTRPAFSLDYRWRSDPAQLLDYNHRGVHNAAAVTQALTKAYYKAAPVRYLIGCSAGGRSARNNARLYGTEDFDGFLASAPPSTASYSLMSGRIAQYIARHPSSWISPELMAAAQQKIIATYDGADGVVDGIVQDERLFQFDASILLSVGFTPEQIQLVEFARASYPHLAEPAPVVNGSRTPGFPIARMSEWTSWITGRVPPPWNVNLAGTPNSFLTADSTLRALYGDDFDWVRNYDFSNPVDFQRWTTGVGDNAGAAGYDYSRMVKGGGKVIFYVGMGDSAMSFKETLVGRQEMLRTTPNAAEHSRLYLVPGWEHCGPASAPGPGATEVQNRLLDALIAWVENGTPAADVRAARAASATMPQRTFLLCPEPQTAVYKGAGADINAADSWRCQAANLPQLFP